MAINSGIALLVDTSASVPHSSARLPMSVVGELFLSCRPAFEVQLVGSDIPYGRGPDAVTIKSRIDEFVRCESPVGVLILSGEVAETPDGMALIVGEHWQHYPRESTISMAWLGEQLRTARAGVVVVALAIDGFPSAGTPESRNTAAPASAAADAKSTSPWSSLLAPVASEFERHLVVVHDRSLVNVLWAGMCGSALDENTGTITLGSFSRYVERNAPGAAMQQASGADTLLCPPPRSIAFSWPVTPAVLSVAEYGPDELVGKMLPGRFRIVRELARGSFGIVYLAQQITIRREVAVKVLQRNAGILSEEGRLFAHEIEAVGRLAHPNIVHILQADITPGGQLFFAMELVPGRDLESLLRDEGTMAEDRAVSLIDQVLSGLAAAHAAGVVHADIKPANIMVVPAAPPSSRQERAVLLDFGLARLKAGSSGHADPDSTAGDGDAFGGTPAFMAPEQLYQGRVDARSDLFSVGLVLFQILTGWRRRSFDDVPPLGDLRNTHLRGVLARALAEAPPERFESAHAFASALGGQDTQDIAVPPAPPFRHLAPLGEEDPLYGRDQAQTALLERVLFQPAVIYTAPSGTGKTSLLRAGLLPRLRELGVQPAYLTCRPGIHEAVAAVLRDLKAPGRDAPRRLILILDQVEALFLDATSGSDPDAFLDTLRDTCRQDHGAARLSLLLCIREDFLARLIERSYRDAIPILRLGPLSRTEARTAITLALARARIDIADELLECLLDDLEATGAELARDMGWPLGGSAVYPPHLQLVCSILYESLEPGDAVIKLDHYKRIGGLGTVLAEHLDRVLDTEIHPEDTAAARALFLELVSSAQTRVSRTETELMAALGAQHSPARLDRVLDVLRARGLVVPVRLHEGKRGWELVHDSLIPRVLAWADRHDLGRRRALELIRHHLRRSTPAQPSLLSRQDLREVARHPEVVDELEREQAAIHERLESSVRSPWTPHALVRRSQRAGRQRLMMTAGLAGLAMLLSGAGTWRSCEERALRAAEAMRFERNLGRFELILSPFDWNHETGELTRVSVTELPRLEWELFEPDIDDLDQPGSAMDPARVLRSDPRADEDGWHEHFEARGGPAFLKVTGRGREGHDCPPSWIRLRRLPGYAERDRERVQLRVSVPTCQTTMAGMIQVPAGVFIRGGRGEPPSCCEVDLEDEIPMRLGTYFIDAAEVPNQAYEIYASMEDVTGHGMPAYPNGSVSAPIRNASKPDHPVTWIDWYMARDYCQFLGKKLPTTEQWEKAARGGLFLDAAQERSNPFPRRNLPWGPSPATAGRANVENLKEGTVPVRSLADGRSPYDVLDMAGNVYEWTRSEAHAYGEFMRFIRGGSWESPRAQDHHTIAFVNTRDAHYFSLDVGVRCALEDEHPGR